MVPDVVVAMQACARIGAIHSVVFGGFSSGAVKDRVQDAAAKVIITANESVRGGKNTPLKATVDEALKDGDCTSVEKVVVFKRTDADVPFTAGRDIWWHDLIANQAAECEPEWVDAEHPLFILYTSGSTGKPKGV